MTVHRINYPLAVSLLATLSERVAGAVLTIYAGEKVLVFASGDLGRDEGAEAALRPDDVEGMPPWPVELPPEDLAAWLIPVAFRVGECVLHLTPDIVEVARIEPPRDDAEDVDALALDSSVCFDLTNGTVVELSFSI